MLAISAIALATSSAAPPPKPITRIGAVRRDTRRRRPSTWLAHRIAADLRKDGDVEAGQLGEEAARSTGSAAMPRSVTTSGRSTPCRLQMIGDELARAGAEVDRGRKGEALNGMRSCNAMAMIVRVFGAVRDRASARTIR